MKAQFGHLNGQYGHNENLMNALVVSKKFVTLAERMGESLLSCK